MPIYEYGCLACGHRFEVRQNFSDPPITNCGQCGKAVEKVISAPAIMFKGSGWYITDYSNKLNEPKSADTGSDDKKEAGTKQNGEKKETTPSPSEAKSADGASGDSTASATPKSKGDDSKPQSASEAASSS